MTQRISDRGRVAPHRMIGSRLASRDVAGVCGLMSVAAAAGAIGLAGGSIDFGPTITERIPAASPVLGAAALAIVVALPMSAATVAGWRRSPRTGDLAILAGSALVGWIAVEIAFIRTFSWLQPACALYGAVVVALGLLLRRSGTGQQVA